MNVQSYLSFEGRAEEAIEFYKSAVDAKVDMMMRFKEAPEQSMVTPESRDKVMHAAIKIGDTQILLSDGQCTGKAAFSGIALALSADSPAEADKLFNALSKGGKVTMPMTETFFANRFGMCSDKFGVGWMVINPKPMG
ncbi:VOC family protein [Enhydrobacter sp.]|jgi:PhnB protein|uniref:VOC family protein n=1 Tax=Enhydrobacter sp. TaxID=1894999 RepID=UPI00262E29AF|nr:VOC family protein [Enhydrobacter sp.]WIM11378.1 MAG: VOC family protein [Enhydrobacter sp.]